MSSGWDHATPVSGSGFDFVYNGDIDTATTLLPTDTVVASATIIDTDSNSIPAPNVFPAIIQFERENAPAGSRVASMGVQMYNQQKSSWQGSDPAASDEAGRAVLKGLLEQAFAYLHPCTPNPVPECKVGEVRNARNAWQPGSEECTRVGETCVDAPNGAVWGPEAPLGTDPQCEPPGVVDVNIWRYFLDTRPGAAYEGKNPRLDYLYLTAPVPVTGYTFDFTVPGTVPNQSYPPAFQGFSAAPTGGDAVAVYLCRHDEIGGKHYLAPGACQGGVAENNAAPLFYGVSHKFRNGYRMVHFLNTDSQFAANGEGGGKFHAAESPANLAQINDLRRGIDSVGSGWQEWTNEFVHVYVHAAQ
jgi:hypothetical protein